MMLVILPMMYNVHGQEIFMAILILGTEIKSELYVQSSACFLTGVSNECKYDKNTWQVIVQILRMIYYQTGSQCRDFRSGIE